MKTTLTNLQREKKVKHWKMLDGGGFQNTQTKEMLSGLYIASKVDCFEEYFKYGDMVVSKMLDKLLQEKHDY